MKKVLQGLFSVKAFRNNYLAAAATTALFLLSHVVYAQPNSPSASAPKYDTTRILQPINADGFYWTGVGKFGGGLVLPNDTFHLSIQSKGALAYKNGKVYEYEGHYWEEAGFKRWFVSPDGSINITNNGDTIKATVTGAPNSSSPGNYIITYPTIERSNDTVDVIPNVVFQQGSLRDTITTGAQYIIPYASAAQKRIDPIFINPSGLLDTAQGVEDSFFAVRPDLPAGSILIADINVYGLDSIVVSNAGLFQKTAGVFIGDDATLETDSANYYYLKAMRLLTTGSFRSTSVGGVALDMVGGSAVRATSGSRVVYIDGDSSVTLRSGGYNHKAQLTAQGEFLIGSSGQVRIPSARLAVIDSTKGFLPPVMRGVRMNAISSPATGLIVYNSDSVSLCLYNGSAWVKLGSGGSGSASTLQQVTDAGQQTEDSITFIRPGTNERLINIKTLNYGGPNNWQGIIEVRDPLAARFGEFRSNSWLVRDHAGQFGAPLNAVYFLRHKSNLSFPATDDTVRNIAISVNGNFADTSGNITISGGSGITPLYFDHIGSGQSNMAGRDATIGDWVYTKNDRTQSFNSSNLFVTADPALNNICYSDGAVTAERNNTAWQFSLNYAKDNLTDTVRLICEAVGSMSSWEWTPETTGNGEQTTSNTRLTALITKLDAAPSDYKAKLITMQYGENDAVTGNLIHFLNNVVKFYDTLRRHPKCDTNIVMQLVYPITNQPINGDSLRRCLDSIYYRTKDIGNRFITAVPHTYPGTASGHPSNDTTDLIGRLCYSNYLQGFGNGPIKPDSSYWKRSISPEFVYTPEKVVIGATSPISSSYIQNVIVNGTSTLAYFGRSNSGSDGNQQALTIITNSAGNTGSLLMHRSEKSGSVVDRNGIGFRDTSITFLDSNQNALGLSVSNNAVGISKQLNVSANALYTGNLLMTTSTQPLRIFNTTTTGVQMIVSNNSTTAATYSSIRFRSGSVGTYDLADLRTIVNAAGDGGHHAIFTRKSSGLAETIRFTDSNRVGIGTTTPTVRLSVVGDGTKAAAFTSGNVGIGTASPAASAALDITSTTQGVLMPRMTATQGSAISSPADALLIYVTDTNGTFTSIGFWGRENGVWVKL